jgi:DNA-binding transcriptional LysR family regulator
LQQDELLSRGTALPEVPFETASYEVALALVSAGVAVALVPTSACHHLDGAVALALEDGPHRVLHAVSPTSTDHLTLIAPMIEALASTAAERVSAAPRDG